MFQFLEHETNISLRKVLLFFKMSSLWNNDNTSNKQLNLEIEYNENWNEILYNEKDNLTKQKLSSFLVLIKFTE